MTHSMRLRFPALNK
ncbi:erythromycin resistance leader peptide [Peribacillus asahii]